jgi:RNA recognition motif-containing protein
VTTNRRVYAGNLAFAIDEHALRDVFKWAGGVERAEIIKDRWTGMSRGFGFVDMMTEEDAACAVAELDGREVMGRAIRVGRAKPRTARKSDHSMSNGLSSRNESRID